MMSRLLVAAKSRFCEMRFSGVISRPFSAERDLRFYWAVSTQELCCLWCHFAKPRFCSKWHGVPGTLSGVLFRVVRGVMFGVCKAPCPAYVRGVQGALSGVMSGVVQGAWSSVCSGCAMCFIRRHVRGVRGASSDEILRMSYARSKQKRPGVSGALAYDETFVQREGNPRSGPLSGP